MRSGLKSVVAQNLHLIKVIFSPLGELHSKRIWCYIHKITVICHQLDEVSVNGGHQLFFPEARNSRVSISN